MFEGKLPSQDAATPLAEPSEGESLRPLRWDDLVARLAAVRDLRAAYGSAAGDASFDASSARRVAAHHNGKHVVNLEDSSNGKGAQGMANEAVQCGAYGVARK